MQDLQLAEAAILQLVDEFVGELGGDAEDELLEVRAEGDEVGEEVLGAARLDDQPLEAVPRGGAVGELLLREGGVSEVAVAKG